MNTLIKEKQKIAAAKGDQEYFKRKDSELLELEKFYKTFDAPDNWYKQSPYSFIFTDNNGTVYQFNLPISPSNLTITTHFATNVISTMYGTVEEHSQQRYFDISISGTTGMAPSYSMYKEVGSFSNMLDYEVKLKRSLGLMAEPGRSSFTVKGVLGEKIDNIGFARRTTNLIANIADQASDILGETLPPPTGISTNSVQTGYTAFHNFYKFLLKYKQDVANNTNATNRKKHPLTFICWKDNTQYDVAINNFQLMRDANDPMLYKYSISIRGYNLNQAGATSAATRENESDRLANLGLSTSGIFGTSAKAFLARKARTVRNIAYSAIALAKSAGK